MEERGPAKSRESWRKARDRHRGRRYERQVLFFPLLFSLFCPALSEQLRYVIPEEMAKGALVGSLAQDLGVNVGGLATRKLRVVSSSKRQHFTIGADTGNLHVNDRIDREEICGNAPLCVLTVEAVTENPFNVFPVAVQIQDINDNSPYFTRSCIDFKISESALPGASFPLEMAQDPDVGSNTVQNYQLSQNQYFVLSVKESANGNKYAELVLGEHLDREKQSSHHLILTAVDGGNPVRTGTTQIRVNVTDANDNTPLFSEKIYKVSLSENLPNGSLVLRVQATDKDEGLHAKIAYSFSNIPDSVSKLFTIDPDSGEIRTRWNLDYEMENSFLLDVEATDGGGLSAHCKLQIQILDENDNAPEMTLTPVTSPAPENSLVGTVIALIKVIDQDTAENGKVSCHLEENFPFKIASSSDSYYKLVTDSPLDRERAPEYNITITATDKGSPPLSTQKTILLQISDVNDNAPVFEKPSYSAYVPENNPSGASILSVKASDRDVDGNARVTYSILRSSIQELPVSSYVSINSQTGALYAQRSFDYEQFRAFELQVRAEDGGSPPLSSNVTVSVFILDRNDNAPRILYPSLGPEGSAVFEMVPRSAEAGYLVTKVVAVDADSGHNAWLSYHVLQATEPALFRLGLHSGEIRTARAFADRDAVKHRLVALVKDNGQPPLSATVTLSLVFAENFQEALPEMSDRSADSAPQSDLQFYLVLALALVSFLFLLTVTLAIAMRLRRSGKPSVLRCLNPDIYSKDCPSYPANYCDGTLPYSYNICFPTTSGDNGLNILVTDSQNDTPGKVLCSKNPGKLYLSSNMKDPNSQSESLLEVRERSEPLVF